MKISSVSEGKAFSLQRTNVRLSTNAKLLTDGDSMWFEFIKSSQYLSRSIFKNSKVNLESDYVSELTKFMNNAPDKAEWYKVKKLRLSQPYEFFEQYEQLYEFGAYTDADSINPISNLRFFAPLWVENKMPDVFVLFKTSLKEYHDLITEINTANLVKVFDISENTKIGKFLRTLSTHEKFTEHCINVDWYERMSFKGIDIRKGEFSDYSISNLQDLFSNERSLIEFENYVTNGWSRGSLAVHNLINLEFVFKENDKGYHTYFGYYGYLKDSTSYVDNALNLLRLQDNYVKWIQGSNEESSDIESVIATRTLKDYEKSYNITASAKLKINPEINSRIAITYKGITIVEFYVDSTINDSSLSVTCKNIKDKLNDLLKTYDKDAITAYSDNETLKIKITNTDLSYESDYRLILPKSFRINRAIDNTGTQIDKEFLSVNTNDIIIDIKIDITSFDKLKVNSELYNVNSSFMYESFNVLRLDRKLVSPYIGQTLSFIKFSKPKKYIVDPCEHKDFFTNTLKSIYDNSMDFDMQKYKDWQLNRIDINNEEHVNIIKKYFQINDINDTPVNDVKHLLVKDIDPVTYENTLVSNEYDRFSENDNEATRNINRLNKFICRFGCTDGFAALKLPMSLNINIAFRFNNFCPDSKKILRDPKMLTHHTFIIGTNCPSYLTDIRSMLSYLNLPASVDYIRIEDIVNPSINVFDYMTRKEIIGNYEKTYGAYSELKNLYDNVWYTVFNGIEYRFEGDYENYKFAFLLIPTYQESIDSQADQFILVDNLDNRTLLLAIKTFIGSQILTDVQGSQQFIVDRSLFYYLNKNYVTSDYVATSIQLLNPISLDIGNRRILDVINNELVTWITPANTSTGQEILLKIQKGDRSRFNKPFTELIKQITDTSERISFEWQLPYDDGLTEQPVFVFTAIDVIEVKSEYFLCRDLIITFGDIYSNFGPQLEPYRTNVNRYKQWYSHVNRHGISIINEYYDEVSSEMLLPKNIQNLPDYIYTSLTGKQYLLLRKVSEMQSDNSWWNSLKSILDTNQIGGSLFDKDGAWNSFKSLSKSNAYYDIVNTQTSLSSMFKLLSMSSVNNVLNSYLIEYRLISSNNDIKDMQKVNAIFPKYFNVLNTMKSVSNELKELNQFIVYPLSRNDGRYSPVFDTIVKTYELNSNKFLISTETFTDSRYVIGSFNEFLQNYERNISKGFKSKDLYVYSRNDSGIINLDFKIASTPKRGLFSTTFSYPSEFSVNAKYKKIFVLYEVLVDTLFEYAMISTRTDIKLSDDEISVIQNQYNDKLKNDGTDDLGLVLFEKFVAGWFDPMYKILKIIDENGKQLRFFEDHGKVILHDPCNEMTIYFTSSGV